VRDIEKANVLANRSVLLEDPTELHRKLPAPEINHLPAKLVLEGVERGFLESCGVV
jgi:hypothetical protein